MDQVRVKAPVSSKLHLIPHSFMEARTHRLWLDPWSLGHLAITTGMRRLKEPISRRSHPIWISTTTCLLQLIQLAKGFGSCSPEALRHRQGNWLPF